MLQWAIFLGPAAKLHFLLLISVAHCRRLIASVSMVSAGGSATSTDSADIWQRYPSVATAAKLPDASGLCHIPSQGRRLADHWFPMPAACWLTQLSTRTVKTLGSKPWLCVCLHLKLNAADLNLIRPCQLPNYFLARLENSCSWGDAGNCRIPHRFDHRNTL